MKQAKAAGLVAFCMVAPWSAAALADVFDDIGLTTLRASGELRAEGAGVAVGQVEARARDGGLVPQAESPAMAGKVFTTHGVPQGPVSDHATYVGNAIYGAGGVAPGVTEVSLFEATAFLGAQGLKTGAGAAEPANLGLSVMNHSWIWERAGSAQNRETLRRLDYLIARDDLVSVHAAANGTGSKFPVLLASSMNGITVGLSDGRSSVGPVFFDLRGGPTIAKPDLVVPEETTSRAAAIVSGAAALLMSEGKARGMNVGGLATKAMLLAGAKHLDGYERGMPGAADDRATPLDYQQGAGELRLDRSFEILVSGEARADAPGREQGWAEGKVKGKRADYNVSLDERGDLSAALTWHRKVTRGQEGFDDGTASVANLDLILQKRANGRWWLVEKSKSSVDNLEIVTRDGLAAGEYRLVVHGADRESFALAWGTEPAEVEAAIAPAQRMMVGVVPEPGILGCAMMAALGLLRRRRGDHFAK